MEASVIIGIIIAIALMALIIYVILMQPDVSTKSDPILPVTPIKPAERALTTSTDAVMQSLKAGLKPIPNTKITITCCLYPGDTRIQPFVLQELNRYKLLLDIELIMVPDTAHYIKLKSTVHNILFELLNGILDVAYGTILCVLASYLPDPLSFVPFPNNPILILQVIMSDTASTSEVGQKMLREWNEPRDKDRYKPELLFLMLVRQSPLVTYINGKQIVPESIYAYYRDVGSRADQYLIQPPTDVFTIKKEFDNYIKPFQGPFQSVFVKADKYAIPRNTQPAQAVRMDQQVQTAQTS